MKFIKRKRQSIIENPYPQGRKIVKLNNYNSPAVSGKNVMTKGAEKPNIHSRIKKRSFLKRKNKFYKILLLLMLIILPLLAVKYFLLLPGFLDNLSLLPHNLKSPLINTSIYFNLAALCQKYGLSLTKINIFNNYYELFLTNDITVYLKTDDLEKQVASLQFILKRFKIEGRKVKIIDLRFSKPIIK